MQVTVGGARYLAGPARRRALARARSPRSRRVADGLPVAVALHTDHCPPDRVDGFCGRCSRRRATASAAASRRCSLAHVRRLDAAARREPARSPRSCSRVPRAGIVLEIECGVVGGEEDGIGGADVDGDRLYTTPEDLLGWPTRSAPASAALPARGDVRQRPRPVRAGPRPAAPGDPRARARTRWRRATPARASSTSSTASSGSSPEELQGGRRYGVVKVNLDSDAQYAFTRAAAGHMFAHYDGVLRSTAGSATSAPTTRVRGGPRPRRAWRPGSRRRARWAPRGGPLGRGLTAGRRYADCAASAWRIVLGA